MEKKKSVCILSFSPICRDARVLRQIKYLSPHYDLTIFGYGQPHPDWVNMENIKWISLDMAGRSTDGMESLRQQFIKRFEGTPLMRLLRLFVRGLKLFIPVFVLFLGRMNSSFFNFWYWRYWKKGEHLRALDYIAKSHCDAIHANDWEALPVAGEASRMNNTRLVFDAHEYAPLELENRRYWRLLFRPAITYFIKKYSPKIDASITVSPLISERYENEFGLNAIVILNTPEEEPLVQRDLNFNNIRLVHHGGAIPDRRLERMIETLGLCDNRFSLHFILLNNDRNYLNELKKLSDKLAPSRVLFREPVPPEEIVRKISEYDVGFYLLEPNSFNNIAALPNKFFDFIVAGLAVCIGPSPSMVEMVRQYGFGCVAPSFDPHDVAETLNQLTVDQLLKMRSNSREVAKKINAQREMKKLVKLYSRLFNENVFRPVTGKS